MKIKDNFRRLIYSENSNSLPTGILATLFVLTFFDAIIAFSLFPYLPHLMKWFGTSEVETGKYAGILGAAVHMSRIFSSYAWGYISDKYGKKYTLIISSAFVAVTTAIFSFSTTFIWALVCRIFQGIFLGIIVIGKSLLMDYIDNTNQELGFAILLSAYTVGMMIGPTIGGYSAFPAEQYSSIFHKNGFFSKYPIFLPNIFITSGIVISIIFVHFVIPKDQNTGEYLYVKESDTCNNPKSYLHVTLEETAGPSHANYNEQSKLLQPRNKSDNLLLQLMRSEGYFTCLMLYGLFALIGTGYMELFPVFLATSPTYHGLGMSLSKIGTINIAPQITNLILNFFVAPKLIRWLGGKQSYCLGIFIFVISTFTNPPLYHIKSVALRWVVLTVTEMMVGFGIAIVSLNLAINNSVDAANLGVANGLAMSVSSLGRVAGPILFGSVFSWSLTNIETVPGQENRIGFPFNQYFAFFIIVITGIITVSYAYYCLPMRLNYKREDKAADERITIVMINANI